MQRIILILGVSNLGQGLNIASGIDKAVPVIPMKMVEIFVPNFFHSFPIGGLEYRVICSKMTKKRSSAVETGIIMAKV